MLRLKNSEGTMNLGRAVNVFHLFSHTANSSSANKRSCCKTRAVTAMWNWKLLCRYHSSCKDNLQEELQHIFVWKLHFRVCGCILVLIASSHTVMISLSNNESNLNSCLIVNPPILTKNVYLKQTSPLPDRQLSLRHVKQESPFSNIYHKTVN